MNTLEKTARAICRASMTDPETIDPADMDILVDQWWMEHKDSARAALEALLEPSGGMIDAPRKIILDDRMRANARTKAGVAFDVFRAMIQAALDGK